MKIILAGNHNPYFFNSVQCREKAFRECGHEIIFFDTRKFFLPGRFRQAFLSLRMWEEKRQEKSFFDFCRKVRPDMVLVVGGDVSPVVVSRLSSDGMLMVLWTTDIVLDPAAFRSSAACYDYVFCSGTEAMEMLAGGGLGCCPVWLPFACDPLLHKPILLSSAVCGRYAHKIVFVGSYYPVREAVLETLTEFSPGIWGGGWDKVRRGSVLRPFLRGGCMRHEEWRKVYCAADIVLSVHYQDGQTPCYQAGPRLFEALACGAFVICDGQKDARALFKDGEHLVFFDSTVELKEKIKYYLNRPVERQRIAASGRSEVLAKHTYRHRVEELLARISYWQKFWKA